MLFTLVTGAIFHVWDGSQTRPANAERIFKIRHTLAHAQNILL